MANLLERGTFLISIDTEMAWGVVHKGPGASHYTYRNEREVIDRLLKLFEKYQIRATWAVVGHLFLDQCQPVNGRKHPEIVRPSYPWFQGDWFDADPCSDTEADPSWYGKDIVKRISACEVPQEIGSHGFSHTVIGDPACSAESFKSELELCQQLAESLEITLKSFVFPRNSVGHLDVLAKYGLIAYRGRNPASFARFSKPSRILLSILNRFRLLSASAVLPEYKNGLWNLPATYFYSPSTYRWRFMPFDVTGQIVKRQLERAVRQKTLVHLWFHSHNLPLDDDKSFKGLEAIFRDVAKLREKGKLDNSTMGDLAESLQRRAIGASL